jgi:integrase
VVPNGGGIRPEEARALRWDHVDLDGAAINVWRSTRAHGDVKTVKSRRTLEIAPQAVEALRRRLTQQERDRVQARELWHETGLVFTTSIGTELDSHNIRRSMRRLTKAAGFGESWTPRELRHTFVSIASEAGVPHRGDRRAGRALDQAHHRTRLPDGTEASAAHGRDRHGRATGSRTVVVLRRIDPMDERDNLADIAARAEPTVWLP